MKEIDFEIEVLNWERHQKSEKRPTKRHWFKMDGDIFFDIKFNTLSVNSKLFWVYLLSECCRANAGKLLISSSLCAKISGIRVNFVRIAVNDLESLQLVKVLTRRKTIRQNREEKSKKNRIEKSYSAEKNMLQFQHETDTIISQTSTQKNFPEIKKKSESKSAKTWESFSNAYRKRYGSEPVRNATTNSQMSNVVKRLGEDEAPEVAAFFVTLNDQWYTKQGHSVGILLKDCEKIRTMWATGKRTIETKGAHYQDQLRAIEMGEI